MNAERVLFPACVLLVLIAFGIQHLLMPAPVFMPSSVPDTQFSGERALTTLQSILPNNRPHPTGSEENKKVKNRIRTWLADHAIESEEQHAWGCHPDRGRCAWTENIIAKVSGEVDGPYLALMAHYDSVAASAGAGDDVVGVAIIMEVARMLKSTANNRNPILLVITDGEENALLGAEAFFKHHPLAKEIALVVNLEGSGSEGASLLFRTGADNKSLVEAFAQHKNAQGSSFFGELYRLLPSDTDVTVAKRSGIRAADIGFSGERNHFHTLNDNIENLSRTTIQHHGENLYSIVRGLSDRDLAHLDSGNVSFDNAYGIFFFWPHYLDRVMLGFALLALVIATRRLPSRKSIFRQVAMPLGLLFAFIVSTALVFLTLHFIRGVTPFWPAHEMPYRIILFSIPVLIGLLFSSRLNQRWPQANFLVGVWWFWWFIAACSTLFVPNLTYVVGVPVFASSLILVFADRFPEKLRPWLYALTLVMVVPSTLTKIMQLETWQGYWLIILTMPFFTLLISTMMPFARGDWALRLRLPIAGLLLIAATATLFLPSFSTNRPHHMNYQLVQNVDLNKAWLQYLSFNKAPAYVSDVRLFDYEEAIYPWGDKVISDLSVVAPEQIPPPSIKVEPVVVERGRQAKVTLQSNQNAIWIGLVIPQNAQLESYEIGGIQYPITPAWWFDWQDNYVLEFRGVQNKRVDVSLNFASQEPVVAWLYEQTHQMPAVFAPELKARSKGAVAVHDGDRFMSFRAIDL